MYNYPLLYTLLAAWGITLVLGPVIIPVLHRLKFGQTVRESGPRNHLKKTGTPTMGGVMFVAAAVVGTVLFAPKVEKSGLFLLVALVTMVGNGAIGFADDFIKVRLKRALGLTARQKLAWQTVLAAVLAWASADWLGLGTSVKVPFLGLSHDLGVSYYPFVIFITLGFVNAVNLTDGLDGLLAGSSAITFIFYTLVALLVQRPDLAGFSLALVGGSMGFLHYNRHPARVFMGDTGSFALGGGLAALAVLTKTELMLPIAGGLYVIETLSVIIQVISFRLTGRRIFRMSPIHHHFELIGWPEETVVRRLWFFSLASVVVAFFGLRGVVF